MKKSILITVILLLLGGSIAFDAEAKKKRKKRTKAQTEQVWTHIAGTYAFSNEEMQLYFTYFDNTFTASITNNEGVGEEYDGDVDEKTGTITIIDHDGMIMFTGKLYRGGNQLRGTLYGKPVILEGMCGL